MSCWLPRSRPLGQRPLGRSRAAKSPEKLVCWPSPPCCRPLVMWVTETPWHARCWTSAGRGGWMAVAPSRRPAAGARWATCVGGSWPRTWRKACWSRPAHGQSRPGALAPGRCGRPWPPRPCVVLGAWRTPCTCLGRRGARRWAWRRGPWTRRRR